MAEVAVEPLKWEDRRMGHQPVATMPVLVTATVAADRDPGALIKAKEDMETVDLNVVTISRLVVVLALEEAMVVTEVSLA